jgi:hypothetical protein
MFIPFKSLPALLLLTINNKHHVYSMTINNNIDKAQDDGQDKMQVLVPEATHHIAEFTKGLRLRGKKQYHDSSSGTNGHYLRKNTTTTNINNVSSSTKRSAQTCWK